MDEDEATRRQIMKDCLTMTGESFAIFDAVEQNVITVETAKAVFAMTAALERIRSGVRDLVFGGM